MTLDTPIEQQFSVGAQRQEIMFKDGTSLVLHPVFDHGTPLRYHRALHLPKNLSMIVDLRSVVPTIADDICAAADRDLPGIVYFTLRHRYSTAELLVRQICERGTVLKVSEVPA